MYVHACMRLFMCACAQARLDAGREALALSEEAATAAQAEAAVATAEQGRLAAALAKAESVAAHYKKVKEPTHKYKEILPRYCNNATGNV